MGDLLIYLSKRWMPLKDLLVILIKIIVNKKGKCIWDPFIYSLFVLKRRISPRSLLIILIEQKDFFKGIGHSCLHKETKWGLPLPSLGERGWPRPS